MARNPNRAGQRGAGKWTEEQRRRHNAYLRRLVDGQDGPAVAVRDADAVPVVEPSEEVESGSATRGRRGGRGKSSPDVTTLPAEPPAGDDGDQPGADTATS